MVKGYRLNTAALFVESNILALPGCTEFNACLCVSKTKTLLIRASPFGGDVGLDKVIERFDAASTAYTHGLFNLQP
jgi:hypothetical protein